MVEVDVREEEMPQVAELEPVFAERLVEARDAGRWPAVEERWPVVGLEQVGADDPLGALEAEVERLGRAHPPILSGLGCGERPRPPAEEEENDGEHDEAEPGPEADEPPRRGAARGPSAAATAGTASATSATISVRFIWSLLPSVRCPLYTGSRYPGSATTAARASATSRSSTRSSADSRPTESRTRFDGAANGASAVEACVIRAGCSIRLSTPPSDSASWKTRVRATRARASSSDSARKEIIPPKSRIWRAAIVWPGWVGRPG